ncbi:MAG: glycosyltransferase family 2 protein [Gemmataceae bacterium]
MATTLGSSYYPVRLSKEDNGETREPGRPTADNEQTGVCVSVCIANWNCREQLRDCLESLHPALQEIDLEIIVVDNGSQDGAPNMVSRDFPDITLVENSENRGFSGANNQAAAKAKGKYLFFLNNDTVVPASSLRKLVEFAESHPEAVMVGPRLRGMDGKIQVSYRSRPTLRTLLHKVNLIRWTGLLKNDYFRYRRNQFQADQKRHVEVLMGAALLVARDTFEKCGGWDEAFGFGGEDLELSTRLGQTGPLVYWPGVEFLHHGRMSTREHIDYAAPQIANGMVRYLEKIGTPKWAILGYKLVVTLDAPLSLLVKSAQCFVRRLQGRHDKAAKSAMSVRAAWAFLTKGLWAFWRT